MARDIFEIIRSRKSVRSYKDGDKRLSEDTIEQLLRAAFAAPSAVNYQPWHFITIDNRQLLDALSDILPYAKMLSDTPFAIAVCGDKAVSPLYWDVDCAAATQNILLAAEALNLGAVWTAVYPTDDRVKAVQNLLGLPENIIPLNVIPIGYPTGKERVKDKFLPAKIHKNGW